MFLAQGVPLLIRVRREGLWAAHQREVSAQRQAEGQAAQRRRRNWERAEGAPEVL